MKKLLLVLVILCLLSIELFADPCEPGQGEGTSFYGEEVFIDVCPMPDPVVGPINPDVTFDPEFGELTVRVAALLDVNCYWNGFIPLAYIMILTDDEELLKEFKMFILNEGNNNYRDITRHLSRINQTIHITLSYEGWTNANLQSIIYYDGVEMTVPDNVVWGENEVSFDITDPWIGVCFYLKNLPQESHKGHFGNHGNHPNPFNPDTNITFELKKTGFVTLEIYNVKGQKVRTLINSELDEGAHQVLWDGTEESGKTVTSGFYFYKLKSGQYASTKKMILMK